MKDLKYIAAYSIPIVTLIGLYLRGIWVWATPIFAFVIIPLLELILNLDVTNLDENESESKLKAKFFDWLLYLNLPIVYGVLLFGLNSVIQNNIETYEFIGLIVSVGIVLGTNGINVAHELGHRHTKERFIGKALLLSTLYMHFYIEHNFGHHLHAATKEDPATAKYKQSVYSFWFTSIVRQYFSAWKIQRNLLKNNNNSFLSFKNDMLWYTIIQVAYVSIIAAVLGIWAFIFVISAALVGVLLLESVNYIEHYGLLRKKTKHGRYERVTAIHSWNSNHIVGRIVLYELTRHSDHHYKTSKKYQVLDCHEDSHRCHTGILPLWLFH